MLEHKILLVDDDEDLRNLIIEYISKQGHSIFAVNDGQAMWEYLGNNTIDLIILDLMLPGEDGLTLLKKIKQQYSDNIAIIMLSAHGDDTDRIVGLEVGADDYLSKPFNPRELLARIRAVLRRNATENNSIINNNNKSYHFGEYRLDIEQYRLYKQDQIIELTSNEFNLLQTFVEHPNRVLSRDYLISSLKGYERDAFDRSIDVAVARLRRKIEQDPSKPDYIRTMRGVGYMFVANKENI